MDKILVVDDEVIERTALQRILRERYAGRCQVETAANGKEAIALAEELRADIVLMDIEMPGINGLEAAKAIREMLPRCRIIIVTAYERFQYARVAITLGAQEYLLKPVANADLFRLIDQALSEIGEDRRDDTRRMALDRLAGEQLVLAAISGYSNAASLQRQLAELDIGFAYGLCSVIKPGGDAGPQEMERVVRPLLEDLPEARLLLYPYDDSLIVMTLLEGDRYYDASELAERSERWVAEILAGQGIQLFVGIGTPAAVPAELQVSYDHAMQEVARCTPDMPVRIGSPDASDVKADRALERRLYGHLVNRDMESAQRCIDAMIDTLFFAHDMPQAVWHLAVDVMGRVGARLMRDARLAEGTEIGLPPETEIPPSPQAMAVCLRALMASWAEALEVQPDSRLQRTRGEIERYIQGHYAQDLSIGQVAKAMHYSEPYFSKLFTRCFQRNFVTYLTDVRMQAAREKLLSSEENIREISLSVGFADANYFAKVFRKAYGVSPTEFRRHVPHAEGVGDS